MAAGDTITVPFCGSCGWDANENIDPEEFCDACGADLNRFGFTGLFPPTDLAVTGESQQVTVIWTEAPDTSDLLVKVNDDPTILLVGETSPSVIAPLGAGDKVSVSVRTVLNGVAGPWSPIVSATALP